MGPQHRCCGNVRVPQRLRIQILALQWGRSIDAAEIQADPEIQQLLDALQWGRSIDAAEIREWAARAVRASVLQWGRSIDAAEIEILIREIPAS